jgi:hypothetical protein
MRGFKPHTLQNALPNGSYSVAVSTSDFESDIMGSNPIMTKTRLAQSVERQPFKAITQRIAGGRGFEPLIG